MEQKNKPYTEKKETNSERVSSKGKQKCTLKKVIKDSSLSWKVHYTVCDYRYSSVASQALSFCKMEGLNGRPMSVFLNQVLNSWMRKFSSCTVKVLFIHRSHLPYGFQNLLAFYLHLIREGVFVHG